MYILPWKPLIFQDYVPDLFAHFYNLGVETHMYASQWFLTLFTAKFPLQMVYFIVDLFLSEVWLILLNRINLNCGFLANSSVTSIIFFVYHIFEHVSLPG